MGVSWYPHPISSWHTWTREMQLWKEYGKGPTRFTEGNGPHRMVGAIAWLIANCLKNKISLKISIELAKVPCPEAASSLELGQ